MASPEAVSAYFETLRANAGQAALDKPDILDAFRRGWDGRLLPFRTVAERFHLIDSSTRTVYLPVDDTSRAMTERLRSGERPHSLFRKPGQYGVNIYTQHFDALRRAGAIEFWMRTL
ncbi:hypothetical protein [Dysosmobacter sp.]